MASEDAGVAVREEADLRQAAAGVSLDDDETIDYITGAPVKITKKEEVRQWVARALFHEYGFSVEDMARDFPVPVLSPDGRKRKRKADIAIFAHGTPHELDNLRRVVVCKPKPNNGSRVVKIRSAKQAAKELAELEELMGYEWLPQITYGLWTNGLDIFFLHKEIHRFGTDYQPRAEWPLAEESVSRDRTVASLARLRRGEAGMLKTAFRRCHNYIHGNEGMPKDAAFWQFLYLLFAKMHDERMARTQGRERRFFVLPDEPFTDDGRRAIRDRVLDLFGEVKREYQQRFSARDEIAMSDRALAFIVSELAPYDLTGTDIDAKGIAYQELVGTNLRGDRGQFFTPRGAVELMVKILDPTERDTVFDPACGTGGFLRETLRHLLEGRKEAEGTAGLPDTEEDLERHRRWLASYAEEHLFGADFDPFLERATSMSIMLQTGIAGNVFHMDSLAFPRGHLPGVAAARDRIPLGQKVDVLMTNPPFGSDIKIVDGDVLGQYRDGVARSWSRDRETGELTAAEREEAPAMAPEQLFIQRSVEWVKPGGRVGIVLPNGILSNPGPADEAIRRWILERCWVLASVELPVETFIVDAHVNILTTLLFLKKKTHQEYVSYTMGHRPDYPVFMAVAEKVGFDRRGNEVYQRTPDGEPVLEEVAEKERIRIRGRDTVRVLYRKRPKIDNDLPEIAAAYHRFREQHPEPGVPR